MALIHERMNRGRTQMGWLDSFHTFSFGGFSDPTRMGFRNLRVINEDRVIPGGGFGTHEHADMDILTYVISGALRHEDSIGNGSVINAGEMQLMSAGTGVTHSEMNASDAKPVHFLQIWLIPKESGVAPRYAETKLDHNISASDFELVAGGASALPLHSDARLYRAYLDEGATVSHMLAPGRGGFLHVVSGKVRIEDEPLSGGDALQFEGVHACMIRSETDAELLVFDLP
ncbi:quercetin 2,3-dioxygenase [Sulfitobacter sp. SK012]|uniref:pirin family protein n=1 Tax=Sulfitobacter sp. SK012 TaxID=1389005 RepID=UPI000E0AA728|nr:pirin family protein [Sulfitobacter sp. SK012]AXI45209.1 quercetin 2,3-dioxygenase [Sulfitobacter sp. SK012]